MTIKDLIKLAKKKRTYGGSCIPVGGPFGRWLLSNGYGKLIMQAITNKTNKFIIKQWH